MRRFFLLCAVFLAPLAVGGAKDSSADSGLVEQCECDALMKCRKNAHKLHTPCIEKCRGKLQHRTWNKAEGLKCFAPPSHEDEHHQCMHEIALQTCALERGVMIPLNETVHWARRRHNHRRHQRKPRALDDEHAHELNEADHEKEHDHDEEDHDTEDADDPDHLSSQHAQHRPREHNKRAFYAFMRRHFGKSGNAFVRCMQHCGKHQRRVDPCSRRLKCGVKRLPPKELHEQVAECHKKQTPRRYEVCNCLKDAGMSRLDCSFGGRGASSKTTDTPSSTTKKPE